MVRYILLLLFIGLAFWSCEEESEPNDDTSVILTSFVKDVTPENYCASSVDIKQTGDGGYIIAGCKDNNAWLMKTYPYGEKEWEQTYSMGDYWGNRTVIQTSDGGYLFAGWEGVLKTDANGTKEWQKKGVPNNSKVSPFLFPL